MNMRTNQIAINLVTNVVAMSVSMLISLWITPYLIHKMGLAAYGYVGLINSLISFMSVLTYTLNSMVGRFLTVSLTKEGPEQASRYISSALYANLLFGVPILLIILLIALNLDKLIKVPSTYATDITLAFILAGVAFILSSISTVYYTGAYSKNRLDVINWANILSNFARAGLLVILFSVFAARIWHYSMASVLQVLITLIIGIFSFKLILPDVHFRLSLFSLRTCFELLASGFFNSIIILGSIFLTQIDLVVGNRFLPAETVGLYAAVLLIPNSIRNIAIALSSAFSPTTMVLYSSQSLERAREYSNNVVRFCGLILGWPVSIISAFSVPILRVWLNKDYSNYESLIILMLLPLTANLAVRQLYNVQQALNKIKIPALASIVLGISNALLAVLFTAVFKMGILGIVLSGVTTYTIYALIFIPIYTSFITKQSWFSYYRGLTSPVIISVSTCAIGVWMQNLIAMETLPSIFFSALSLSFIYAFFAFSLLVYEGRKNGEQNAVVILRRFFEFRHE